MVLPSVSDSAARAGVAHANNIRMAGDTARMTNKNGLMAFVSLAVFFGAAQGGWLPIGQVTECADVEFRGKLVFILLYALFQDSF